MKIFKYFNKREYTLLIVSFCGIFLSFFIAPVYGADRSVLSLVASLVGVVGIILMSRGIIQAHCVYIAYSVLYIAVSVTSRYYGEAIIYGIVMLPIHIFSIISWKKNMTESKSVKISNSNNKEFVIMALLSILLTVPFYFLLKYLKTDNLIIGTLSFCTSFVAALLMIRRSKYYAVIFAIDDVTSIILWGTHIWFGTYKYIPTLITVIVLAVNDTYSFICWLIRAKKQKELNTNEENEK